MAEQVSASRKLGEAEALEMARVARRLIVAKGRNITRINLSSSPSKSDILEHMLGPTGNLRAPTLRVGDVLYVGFPKEGFEELR